jgi:formyl-CoA transferase
MSQGVLSGIRVIDMATYIFGPASTTVMSDFGAEVIKIEGPGIGDPYRYTHMAPPFPPNDLDYMFQHDNRNKRGIVLDVKIDAAREVLLELLRKTDVFVTNFPPQVLERLRIRYEDLAPENDQLIYAQVTGYGENGAEIDKPGFDATAYWARTGLMDLVRPPDGEPALSAAGMGDHPSAMALFGGIVLALYKREKTGKGSKVSSSLMANGAWANACMISSTLAGCQPFEGIRRESPPNALINQYPTRDGRWVLLIVITPDKDWVRFANAIDRGDLVGDSRFGDQKSRNKNSEALAQELESAFRSRDFAEWKKILDEAQITFSVVGRTDEAPHDPQMLANDLFVGVDQGELGRKEVVNSPIWLRGETKREPTRAPKHGEHTDDVLGELGYDAAQIDTLRRSGALGDA